MDNPKEIHEASKKNDERHFSYKKELDARKILSFFSDTRFQICLLVIYVSFELLVVFKNGGKGSLLYFSVYYLNNLAFVYLNCLLVLPNALRTFWTGWKPLAWIFASLSVQVFMLIFTHALFFPGKESFWGNIDSVSYINSGWLVVKFFLLSIFIWGSLFLIKLLIRQKMLENNYLYSRISPHLLHNALNMVHSNVQQKDDNAGEMIMSLSSFARSAMRTLDEDGKIKLRDEIAMIIELINITRLRFEEEIYITNKINLNNEDGECRIPPQIIVTLIENAIKYGTINNPNHPLIITVSRINGMLFIEITNYKNKLPQVVTSHQLGISNVKRRLENLYGEQYSLYIEDGADIFKISINLPI